MTAEELAAALKAKIVGDPGARVVGICSLDSPKKDHLGFILSPKSIPQAKVSPTQVFLVPQGITMDQKTVLQHPSPRLALAQALLLLREPIPMQSGIHPTALISPLATVHPTAWVGPFSVIGDNVHIGPSVQILSHAFIGSSCSIGEGSILHPFCSLYPRTSLGSNVILHSHVTLGSDGFSYAQAPSGAHCKIEQIGSLCIQDDVEIGAHTAIDRASLDQSVIGKGVKIDNLVHIGHNAQIGDHTIILAETVLAGSVKIGRYCILSGHVTVSDHVQIVDHVMIRGKAGVTKSILQPGFYAGDPCQPHREELRKEALIRRLPRILQKLNPSKK